MFLQSKSHYSKFRGELIYYYSTDFRACKVVLRGCLYTQNYVCIFTMGANLHCLIYNVVIDIIFPYIFCCISHRFLVFFVNFEQVENRLGIRRFHYRLAQNCSYCSQGTAVYCKSFIPSNKQSHTV